MAQQQKPEGTPLKPEDIPYKFYVIFYRYILDEFSWTWNLRLNGRQEARSNNCKHILAVVLSAIAALVMLIILVCRLFPTGKPSALIKGVIGKIFGNVELWIGWPIFIVIIVGIIVGIVIYIRGSWSERDKYLRAGLALHEWKSPEQPHQEQQPSPEQTTQPEQSADSQSPPPPGPQPEQSAQQKQSQQEYKANGVPNDLATSLSRAGNPMCWGYAMRLYCEKALMDATSNGKLKIQLSDIIGFIADFEKNNIKKADKEKYWYPEKIENFISYIPHNQFWNYEDLYKEATGTGGNGSSITGSTAHIAQIERFLKQTAHDFCQQYVQTDSFWSKKHVWVADPKKTQYFRDTWNARIENLPEGNEIKKQKKEYMDIVISEMQDANENANRHLRERTRLRKRLFILPIATALVSAVTAAVTEMFDQDQLPVWVKITLVVITLTGAALTAWQAVMQEYGKEAEETWLRQKVCFAKLQSETQMFCDSLGDYDLKKSTGEKTDAGATGEATNDADANDAGTNSGGQSDNSSGNAAASADAAWTTKQIETYIQNVEKIRKTDWKKFFDNMNCGDDVDF